MKNKLFIYVGLAASLLCSCAQSDVDNGQEQGKGQGSTVLHLSATATGGDATRVSVGDDATNGLITKWTSSDKLNVWNLYGSTLSRKDFKNSLTEGKDEQTTDFTCETSGTTFTPYSTIYAFNNLVSGGSGTYSQGNSSGTFTLNLSGYDKQDGTLANMNKYDALYGTTTANNDGRKNNSLTMNHLTTAMCFTLTNADFNGTTLTKLTVNCGGTSTSILPASCTATLNAGGELAYTSRTGATKWTVTGINAADHAFKVYLMTFPFKNISGPLEFIVETSAGKYYSRYVTMNNLSLNAGTVYNRTVAMTEQTVSVPSTFTKSDYYQWDAYSSYVSGNYSPSTTYFKEGQEGYNPTSTVSDDRVAEHSCVVCPTAREIYAYLLAGAYWDDGSAFNLGGTSGYSYPPSYTLSNGITYNTYDQSTHTLDIGSSQGGGLWLPKNSYIKTANLLKGQSGIGNEDRKGVEDYTGGVSTREFNFTVITTSNAATIRESGNYFFLPAAGYYYASSSSVSQPGSYCCYWSSSTYDGSIAYGLGFRSGTGGLNFHDTRNNGFLLWGVQ